MLTIGQLAAYAGVTIRAVRHYHHVGLLPEPDRDASGYRTYDAGAVVRLIRIRTLAEAGVPLARVQDLLDADPAAFAAATTEIDRALRAQVRELQEHRRRIAQLADPRTVRFYRLVGRVVSEADGDQEALALEMADLLAEMFEDAAATGQLDQPDLSMDDAAFVGLLDSMATGHPLVTRLQELLAERGWTGWTKVERR